MIHFSDQKLHKYGQNILRYRVTLKIIHMEALIYSRVSSVSQDYERQIFNLKTVAQEKDWHVRRTFQEKISGTINPDPEMNLKHYWIILTKHQSK